MFWRERVPISQEMYKNSILTIYICRFSGYFSLTVKRVGATLFLQWSVYYALYSFVLGASLSAFAGWELYVVYLQGSMMSPTDKITQVFAHGGWMILFFLGVFVIGNRFKKFFACIRHLNQIDAIIRTNHGESERWLSVLKMMVAPAFDAMYAANTLKSYYTFGLTFFDYAINNLGYYTLVMLATIVFYNVRHMIYSLEKRVKKINELLEATNQNWQKMAEKPTKRVFVVPRQAKLGLVLKGNTKKAPQLNEVDVLCLAIIYLKLCDAAEIINELFSATMGIGIVFAFIQVVQPAYFFIASIRGLSAGNPISTLMSSLFALSRNFACVLLVINSSYGFSLQVKTMEKLVCRLLCWKTDAKLRAQVKIFARCLGLRKIEFSAWNLFTVDRLLFADMIGAVVTFLFLLLQLQERERP